MVRFSEKLKELREEKNLKQSDLGKLLSVDQSTICTWETGSREPDFEMLVKLAKLFDVTTDYLLGVED